LAVLLGGACSTRGSGPDSIEVGGACDPNGDFNGCEEACFDSARTCVFRCTSDGDCPTGSACTAIRLPDDDQSNVCLPLCSTVPCPGYEQGLCCGAVARVSGMGLVNVCFTASSGQGFACGGI
jgi:hypothetical protein